MIGIQKMYGLSGLNHRILEKVCDVNHNIVHQIMLKPRKDAEGSTQLLFSLILSLAQNGCPSSNKLYDTWLDIDQQ